MPQILRARGQPGPLIDVDHLVREPGGGEDTGQQLERRHPISDLFFQLARGTGPRVLTGMQLARRNFVDEAAGRMPVLSNQHHRALVLQRHNGRRTGMTDDFQFNRGAIRQRHGFQIERHDPSFVDVLVHGS